MIEAICSEIGMNDFIKAEDNCSSIYFGGGTPSLLSHEELEQIFNALKMKYHWNENIEITLEANPDDINVEQLNIWKEAGINRLSIGIQSFYDVDLKWMNRAHNSDQARKCIELAQECGFDNLTVDLIYGSPTTTDEMWRSNIEKVIDSGINHISSYCLTVEEGTALAHFIKKGRTMPLDQDKAVAQFDMLMDLMEGACYEHYEISNFAKKGYHAIHNTSYWKGVSYIGYGPSAHSYNGVRRQWNIAHNMKYINAIESGSIPSEYEELSIKDQYNELVLVRLRTMWGINMAEVTGKFKDFLHIQSVPMIESGLLKMENDVLTLTRQGKHMADYVSMELMYG